MKAMKNYTTSACTLILIISQQCTLQSGPLMPAFQQVCRKVIDTGSRSSLSQRGTQRIKSTGKYVRQPGLFPHRDFDHGARQLWFAWTAPHGRATIEQQKNIKAELEELNRLLAKYRVEEQKIERLKTIYKGKLRKQEGENRNFKESEITFSKKEKQ